MGFIIAFALWPQNFFSFLIKHYFNKFYHLEIYFPTVCSIYEVILLPISVILIEFSSLKFKLLIWFWNKVIIFPINCEPSSEIALQLGCVLFTPGKFLLIGGNFKCYLLIFCMVTLNQSWQIFYRTFYTNHWKFTIVFHISINFTNL